MVTAPAVANTPAAWSVRSSAATSWEAAMWSRTGQVSRFAAVLEHLSFAPGDSLLDYGCGTGALCEFVPDDTRVFAYDWSEGMRARATVDHGRRIVVVDHDELLGARFDHVVAVGTFNLADNWWKQRTWDTLDRLWNMCRKSLVVSLYRGNDPACIRYTPMDVAATVVGLGATSFVIDGTHLDNDLIVAAYK